MQASLNKDILNIDKLTFIKVQKTGQSQNVQQAGFRLSNSITGKGKCSDDNSFMSTYEQQIGLGGSNFLRCQLFENGCTLSLKRAFVVEKLISQH